MIQLNFDKMDGLITVIAQDHETNEVLMVAFMNQEAWGKTCETGKVHYFSRTRNKLWFKGEESGNVQIVKEILVDCDYDCLVIKVEQIGGAACHTGYNSCFYRKVDGEELVQIKDARIFDPAKVYKK